MKRSPDEARLRNDSITFSDSSSLLAFSFFPTNWHIEEPSPVIAASAGAVVWLVRLEGRINTADAMQVVLRQEVQYMRSRLDGQHE